MRLAVGLAFSLIDRLAGKRRVARGAHEAGWVPPLAEGRESARLGQFIAAMAAGGIVGVEAGGAIGQLVLLAFHIAASLEVRTAARATKAVEVPASSEGTDLLVEDRLFALRAGGGIAAKADQLAVAEEHLRVELCGAFSAEKALVVIRKPCDLDASALYCLPADSVSKPRQAFQS